MNSDDRKYLAYLTAWAVDRVATTIYHAGLESGTFRDLCTYPQLLEQADELLKAHPWPEKGEKTSRTYTWKATPPKKEMTAKELVDKIIMWGVNRGRGDIGSEFSKKYSAEDLIEYIEKEAGL